MLSALKTLIKANPAIYRLALSVRAEFFPTEEDRLQHFLAGIAERIEKPIFVKVGANDGVTNDPCGDYFLRESAWRGLLIEPVPYLAGKLKQTYSDTSRFTIDQVAVGAVPGSTKFYYVSEAAKESGEDLPSWIEQLGSFDRDHIVKHLNGQLEPFIVDVDVTVEPLSSILPRHDLGEIEFLHIDTEGHDLKVLKTIDLSLHRPIALFIEYAHLSADDRTEMKSILESAGYDVRNAGIDYFALHRDAEIMIGSRNRKPNRSSLAISRA